MFSPAESTYLRIVMSKKTATTIGDAYYDETANCMYVIGNDGTNIKVSSSPGSYDHASIEEALKARE